MIQISRLIHSDQFKQKAIPPDNPLAIPVKPQTLALKAPREMTGIPSRMRMIKNYQNILNNTWL